MIIDLKGSTDNCQTHCAYLFTLWGSWINSDRPFGKVFYDNGHITHSHKPAMIIVPSTFAEYLKMIGCKSRNMIKKCQRQGYFAKEIEFNDYLQDIYETNISMPVRQGRPMSEHYYEKPKPQSQHTYCDTHFVKYYGVVSAENKLVAWANISFMNELCIINQILGHGNYLKYGIMNEILSFLVKQCIEFKIKAINYLTIENNNVGLQLFKKSVGFKPINCKFIKNI